MIIETVRDHRTAIVELISESGQFDEEGIHHVLETLDAYLEGSSNGMWFTALDDAPIGAAYCAPEPVTSGTWNLLFLWLKGGYAGRGFGRRLVAEVESSIKDAGARLLIVETSQLPEFETARAFYASAGFTLEAEIKDFFDAGDNKLVYTKRV